MNRFFIISGLFAFFLSGCQKQLSPEDYTAYVSDPNNGLRKDKVINGFEISIMYEPVDFLMAQDDLSSIDNGSERRNELEQFEHFQFRIKALNGSNVLLFNETKSQNEVTRINHFSFYAKNDFELVSGNDTNQCMVAHYSRNYNLSPTVDLSLAFDPIEKDHDWQLIYVDKQFNLGIIKFLFKEEDITGLPELKY